MQMEQLYQEIILDHHRNPHHQGLRVPFDAQVHHVNPTCGDEITLRITLDGEGLGAIVVDISYDGIGCSISSASTSVMTDLVIGKDLASAFDLLSEFSTMVGSRGRIAGNEDVLGDGIAFAGVSRFPARVKCALLGWMAFKDAAAQVASGAVVTDPAWGGTESIENYSAGKASQ
ncbi:SUF system NifU family Fe-S cluster assembly protein [Nakamurella antarctica]|uniref:SUF system NifU family Fe-S cluster assembly protein n=1 Tax=Nakamurella antarctica TaxID=1902245 RepID=A0A3G8ZLN1_9ACTN|nr:SUF system NifU family Fe-S cluster assembly protein [Nakamurella antarctica]AZI58058.1 SUF system NifU family Fe-S cluster assembly protein [Nakamurella antarctica]